MTPADGNRNGYDYGFFQSQAALLPTPAEPTFDCRSKHHGRT